MVEIIFVALENVPNVINSVSALRRWTPKALRNATDAPKMTYGARFVNRIKKRTRFTNSRLPQWL